jgi:hypothetical protein
MFFFICCGTLACIFPEACTIALVSTTEELLGRNSSGYGLENRNYSRSGSDAMTTLHLLSAIVVTNFADDGGRSVGRVRSRTQAKEFVCFLFVFEHFS